MSIGNLQNEFLKSKKYPALLRFERQTFSLLAYTNLVS